VTERRVVAAPPAAELPGYELLGELGKGAMGVVYKARHLELDRVVALKMILAGPHASAGELARFRTEAEAVARLQHPNIVQIYEVGEHAERPYFSLEFVDGGTLAAKLHGTPQPAAEAAQLTETLARAMHFAHQRGIVHRDLKPANVLLTADATPKISDFGLAKKLDDASGQTHTGQVMGTPRYMAPEQAAGHVRDIGPLSDVYALGVIFYEMLTGRAPFQGTSVLETLEQVRTQEPLPPSRLLPKVPRDLETICLKCLQKEPRKRYASAAELADDLHRYLHHEPILARPVGRLERSIKWMRRHPVRTLVATIVVVGTVSVVAGTLIYQQQRFRIVQNQLETAQRLASVRAAIDGPDRAAQAAVQGEDFAGAKLQLARALAAAAAEPALPDDLRQRTNGIRAELAELDAIRQKYDEFSRHRGDVLFHETQLTGLSVTADQRKMRQAAEEALKLFDPRRGQTATSRFLGSRERADIQDGSYELLLVLADLDARGKAAERGLAILDQVAALRPPSAAYHLARNRCLAQLGDAAAAAKEQSAAEALRPASAFDYFLVARSWYQEENWDKAVRNFEQVIRLDPKHFWAHLYLAACYLRMPLPQPERAKASLTACLACRTDMAWVYLLRGYANSELREYAAAAADFATALERHPDATAEYGVRVNRGVLYVRQATALDTVVALPGVAALCRHDGPALVVGAVARQAQQQYLRNATDELQQAIRLDPKLFPAYLNLAQVYQKQGKSADALAQLDKALDIAQADKEVGPATLAALYRERAQFQAQRRQGQAALEDYERAISLKPMAADYVEKAQLLLFAGKFEAAAAACATALKLRPGYATAYRWQAEALLNLRRYRETLVALDSYEQLGRPPVEFYRTRGLTREKLGDAAGAVADFSRALQLAPDAATYAQRGWAYLLHYDASRLALPDFEEALRRDPENSDVYTGRGYALVQIGKYQAGVADAEKALAHKPVNARLLYKAARIYAQAAGKMDAAGPLGDSQREQRLRYQDRAVDLLSAALRQQPADERAGFWRDYAEKDPALRPLVRVPAFAQLALEYGRR
jgi:tetratricopeptide (TPR) repeat protein